MDIETQKTSLNFKITLFTWIGGISAGVALVPLIWAAFQVFQTGWFYHEHELGDFIGGTSGTFASFAGLAFVYVGFLGQRLQILMQQEELEMNRQELRDTRVEIQGQREQLELQNKQFQIQSFENVFFSLIKMFGDICEQQLSAVHSEMETHLNQFISTQRSSNQRESWETFTQEQKCNSYATSFDIFLGSHTARTKPVVDGTIGILFHIEKHSQLVDADHYLGLFVSSIKLKVHQLLFYAFFSRIIYISTENRILLRHLLSKTDASILVVRSDKSLIY